MSIEKVIEGLTAAIEKQTTAIEVMVASLSANQSTPSAPPKKKAKAKVVKEEAPVPETAPAAEHPMPTPTAQSPSANASPKLEGPALKKFIEEMGVIVKAFGAEAGEIHEILNAPPYSVERVSELTVAQSVDFLAACKALKESKGL